MRFFERMVNTTTACAVVSGVAAGAIAWLSHDTIMDAIGNPAADILTLLIIAVGPRVLSIILSIIATSGLRKKNPELYQMWVNSSY